MPAEPFEPTPEKKAPFSGEWLACIFMYAAALFVCVCYMFPASAGFAGWMKSVMCGLFGAAGFLLPVLLIAAALFLRADRKFKCVHWRIVGSAGAMLFIAMFLHGFSAVNILETLKAGELWQSGVMIKSGGVLGGWLGSLVYRGLGRAGVFIVSGAALICVFIILAAISNTDELRKALDSFGRGIDGTGRGIKGAGSAIAAFGKSVKKALHSFGMRLRGLIGMDDNSPDSADVDQNRAMIINSPARPPRIIRRPYDSREASGYSGVRPSSQAFDGAMSEIGIGRPPEFTYSSDTGEYIADSDRPYSAPGPESDLRPAPQQEGRADGPISRGRIEKHRDYVEIYSRADTPQPAAPRQEPSFPDHGRPRRDMRRIEFDTPLYDTGAADIISDVTDVGDAPGETKKRSPKRAGSSPAADAVKTDASDAAHAESALDAEEKERTAAVSRAAAAYAARRKAEAEEPAVEWRTPRKEYTSTDRNGYMVPTGYCDDPRVYGVKTDAASGAEKAPKSTPESAAAIYNDLGERESAEKPPVIDADEPEVHPIAGESPASPGPGTAAEETASPAGSEEYPKKEDAVEDGKKEEKTEELIPNDILMRFISGGRKDSAEAAEEKTEKPEISGEAPSSGAGETSEAGGPGDKPGTEAKTEETAPEPVKKPEYKLPPLSLLKAGDMPKNEDISEELSATAKNLTDTLKSFKVSTHIVDISRGPTITRYELQPDEGVRVKQIINLVDDISLNLATAGVRIEAPIPGKSAVGVEVPNKVKATVWLRTLLENPEFRDPKEPLRVAMGMDVAGEPVWCSIDKMPHMLIAGATGMGKSVCINSMVISLLYRSNPDDVKLIMVDPKKVELNVYNGLPHLLLPVVSEPKRAAGALQWAVNEMERRYTLIERTGVRNIEGYNKEILENPEYRDDPDYQKCPYIVIFIDELADLMMTAPDSVEDSICRIAQKARAAGMHLVIGTQRPSVDVITGLIKANVPSRAACKVSSQMDSRVILDVTGAEKLIGRGDMLFAPVGAMKPIRIQGSFVSDKEVEAVVKYIKDECEEFEYDDAIQAVVEENAQALEKNDRKSQSADLEEDEDDDPMLREAIKLAVDSGKISTSLIQRRLSLGYGRAAKLIDRMQEMGVVSEPEGQKPRTVLITKEQWREMTMREE